MKERRLNKEEELFRDKLNELDYNYDPADWSVVEENLSGSSPVSSSWLSINKAIGIAAVGILVVGGIYFLNSNQESVNANKEKAIENPLSTGDLNQKVPEEQLGSADQKGGTESSSEADVQRESQSQSPDAGDQIDQIAETSVQKVEDTDREIEKVEDNVVAEPKTDKINAEVVREELSIQQNELAALESEFEFNGLKPLGEICPGSTFKIEIDTEGKLPENHSLRWLVDGQTIAENSRIEGLELKENGMREIVVQLKNAKGEILEEDKLTVESYPEKEVDFHYKDLKDPYQDLVVDLEATEGFEEYQWQFEGEKLQTTDQKDFQYAFNESGIFDVLLKVKDAQGCSWSIQKPLAVKNDFDPLAPNAFTPNLQDGTNDYFIPKAFTIRNDNFKMEIYDLHGKLIYRTLDVNEGWNGRKDNSGQMMPAGRYIWKVMISNEKGQEKAFAGNFRLLN